MSSEMHVVEVTASRRLFHVMSDTPIFLTGESIVQTAARYRAKCQRCVEKSK